MLLPVPLPVTLSPSIFPVPWSVSVTLNVFHCSPVFQGYQKVSLWEGCLPVQLVCLPLSLQLNRFKHMLASVRQSQHCSLDLQILQPRGLFGDWEHLKIVSNMDREDGFETPTSAAGQAVACLSRKVTHNLKALWFIPQVFILRCNWLSFWVLIIGCIDNYCQFPFMWRPVILWGLNPKIPGHKSHFCFLFTD